MISARREISQKGSVRNKTLNEMHTNYSTVPSGTLIELQIKYSPVASVTLVELQTKYSPVASDQIFFSPVRDKISVEIDSN